MKCLLWFGTLVLCDKVNFGNISEKEIVGSLAFIECWNDLNPKKKETQHKHPKRGVINEAVSWKYVDVMELLHRTFEPL